jgi:tetratricopeptide (TPR) repeat protein
VNYKEALLIGAFYQNKDYSTVIRLGSNLLSRRPDYKPVLKIVGFSAYLTNQFERAEGALKKYKTLDSKDPEVDFILGLIYFAREDYKLSNLYFNNAILGGYKPKNIVERKLAYNYGILGMNENMFQVLGHLVENPDATELDITNALYLALTEKNLTLAEKWIKLGVEKSPDSPDILSLRAWYMRLTGNTETALTILDTILAKNPNHLIALVQAGIIHGEK